MRIGFGYDVHPLHDGLTFTLGGIVIPHTKGAQGHSDADTLIHAICDALLGAANLGDIGLHFPDNSGEFKGIDSKILLRRTMDMIREKGYTVSNVDSTICLQKPKIRPFIPQMVEALAHTMQIPAEDISIKATTTEKLGFVGREEGIAAHAVVLLEKKN
ncbi:MAG TPA: 2-C-methyl-D-erythritol 2,4-cyclodiphosphate synthase [Bacteroidales bacterium]|nr:2-C-methyl-D-erythritol 2,4-cyclodiphosphate synthase [Bacteroidales bacterium]